MGGEDLTKNDRLSKFVRLYVTFYTFRIFVFSGIKYIYYAHKIPPQKHITNGNTMLTKSLKFVQIWGPEAQFPYLSMRPKYQEIGITCVRNVLEGAFEAYLYFACHGGQKSNFLILKIYYSARLSSLPIFYIYLQLLDLFYPNQHIVVCFVTDDIFWF